MTAKQIKVKDKNKLFIRWEDDTESTISLNYLRDECPCANCKGETVLLKTYRPAKVKTDNPDRYKITDIKPVGGYGVQATWKDGHNTGIYIWNYLKELSDDEEQGTQHKYENIL